MAAEPVLSPMAMCEICWLQDNANWEPQSVNEEGNIMMRLVGVKTPEIFEPGNVDVCCMCGAITIAGIYELKDPQKVYFLTDDSAKDFEYEFDTIDDEQIRSLVMAKDTRHGEHLWSEWSGCGLPQERSDSLIYFTIDHIDVEHELIRKALASTIQRDGVVDSLGDAFKRLELSKVVCGWIGTFEEDTDLYACDETGETEYGDIVQDIQPITWVEI